MRGAERVCRALEEAGCRTIFALSGNQIMGLFDASIDAGLELVHVRHEAAAVHMAEAWAQLTGEVGIALVTAGPGFANALSPLLAATQSESPLVLLSGDSPLSGDGRGAFQELDQTAAARPLAKAAWRAGEASALGSDVARAIQLAGRGRPGPVHLALPFDLLSADTPDDGPEPRHETPIGAPEMATVGAMIEAMENAARPIVLTGPALNRTRAGQLLGRLETALAAPVVAMESPRGLRDPALGAFAGVLARADLVLALAKRIDFTLGFAGRGILADGCRAIVIDPDEMALARAREALGGRLLLAERADGRASAEALLGAGLENDPPRRAWRAEVQSAIARRDDTAERRVPAGRISPGAVGRAVQACLDGAAEPVLVSDGGEFGQWAQATIDVPGRIINGPAGAIGGALPQAIAARLARPRATVLALMGDGTIGFNLAEFETACRLQIPFVAVVGNDARWNAEYQIQLRDHGPDRLVGCELSPARYDLAVQGLGGHGEHVVDPEDLAPALERALASGLPACVNVEIEGLPAPNVA